MFSFNKIYRLSQRLRLLFIGTAALIVTASLFFTNRLTRQLATEEHKKMEIWAGAMRQVILAGENTDINFLSEIISGNTTIPVIMTDENDNLISSLNVNEPASKTNDYYRREIERLKKKNSHIEVRIDNTLQHIYYDDSLLLKQLRYFPYIQLGVIFIFLLIAYLAFSGTKKAEQNQVWVGLSKETAHQLGTPISSLLAWLDLLRIRNDDKLLTEMEKDVNRLKIIAERFSKIGSAPDLQLVKLNETITNAVQYISHRSSQKVIITCHFQTSDNDLIRMNVPLFEWVIENLCKNAIDAMNGNGKIDIFVQKKSNEYIVDVKDTGKGIEKNKFKAVFSTGYTTKPRGWGLGLSLAKRIIEEYHKGKIFVKQSEIDKGTTFRILMKA
ncbi:MAG TPA: HAMP domain-containing sensor histidine kinase [Paludibacteraceae bacterium]|jgi:signal transduction histidine kinase|nr:HAMP domain-containing histidine kinase [Paludibacteraceae bacterium]OPZ03312.1 MAG: Sensor protein ZraS [Bacteroidetes bacterium ADurb.BinA395]HOF98413.1 HAMP domain-containing sensor histidine kinase [Paludibacteraceae bacterium]HOR38614.1 HAMP domain-containing sensor histidine kinase [Paludibacteraceae bacterium]HPL76134.1 HAMP domain-containing sensor histidine kinase [Paludibacteraceae bacterium]